MSRGIKYTIIGLSLVAFEGCQTSGNGYARKSSETKDFAVYATDDTRTAMPLPKDTPQMTRSLEGAELATKDNAKNLKGMINLAQLQLAFGKYDEAEKTCRQALRIDLKNRDIRKILAQIALRRDNPGLASIILNAIGGERSKDAEVHNMMALIELKRGDNSKAMEYFQSALKLDPDNVAVRMNLGVQYLKYRQLNAAARQFERIVKLIPEHKDARLHLAIVHAALGKNSDAESVYEEVLSAKKNNPLALYNLAVLQKNQQEYDDALDTLKTYLRTATPKSSESNAALALIDSIQKLKSQNGEEVSDSEIETLAAKMSDRVNQQAQAKTKRQTTAEASKPMEKTATKKSTAAAAPTKKADSKKEDVFNYRSDSGDDYKLEEIGALEKQLLK